jgi:Tfp pilus assembly protein PilP
MIYRVRAVTLGLIAALAVLPAAAQQKQKAEKQPAVKQQLQPPAKPDTEALRRYREKSEAEAQRKREAAEQAAQQLRDAQKQMLQQAQQNREAIQKRSAVKQQPQPAAKAEARQRAGERRDPFVAVIRRPTQGAPPPPPACGPGVRSLIIGQTDFNGVVKAPAGMIAVVTANPGDRTYFLKEGTPLCDGRVVKITPDAVVFEEDVIDVMGKPAKREVIKRIPTEAK